MIASINVNNDEKEAVIIEFLKLLDLSIVNSKEEF